MRASATPKSSRVPGDVTLHRIAPVAPDTTFTSPPKPPNGTLLLETATSACPVGVDVAEAHNRPAESIPRRRTRHVQDERTTLAGINAQSADVRESAARLAEREIKGAVVVDVAGRSNPVLARLDRPLVENALGAGVDCKGGDDGDRQRRSHEREYSVLHVSNSSAARHVLHVTRSMRAFLAGRHALVHDDEIAIEAVARDGVHVPTEMLTRAGDRLAFTLRLDPGRATKVRIHALGPQRSDQPPPSISFFEQNGNEAVPSSYDLLG